MTMSRAMMEQAFLAGFGGPRIIPDDRLVEQFRFPKSRKRRIRKKFAKTPANFRPSTKAYATPDGALICHPTFVSRLRMRTGF